MYDGTLTIVDSTDVSLLKTYSETLSTINGHLKKFSDFRAGAKAVLETMQDLTPGYSETAKAAGEVAKAVSEVANAEEKHSIIAALGEKAMGLLSKNTVLYTAVTKVATAVQAAWVAVIHSSVGIIMILIAAIAAVVAIAAVLINTFSKSTEAYQAQKKEVEELASAQKELANAAQESADAYDDAMDRMNAGAKVADQLVDGMSNVSFAIAQAGGAAHASAAENKRMADYCTQLNSAVDGLNIAYDEETGLIKDLNTGELMSISTLREQIKARTDLAKTDAGTEQYNKLLAEQVEIQEELALIEQQKREIENGDYSDGKKKELLQDLEEMETEYAARKVEIANELIDLDAQLAESTQNLAGQTDASYTLMESAVTSSGESIAEVAAQWGTSSGEILAAMEEQGITLDEWVDNQESAWEDYQAAVSEKTAAVVNSFQEIPNQFDMSGQQMLDNLVSNKERYAAWEANMAEITRLLGPTAAEEFRKLGPEANSALEEILNTEGMLEQYAEAFGVQIGNATTSAEEKWSDPNFIGAPNDALTASAEQVEANGMLPEAAEGQIEETKQAFQSAVKEANFEDVGRQIVIGIYNGMGKNRHILRTMAKQIATEVVDIIKGTLGVKSPSRVMTDIFKNVMLGVIKGMDDMKDKTYATAAGIANGVADRLTLTPDQAGLANAKLLALSSTSLSGAPSAKAAYGMTDRFGGESGEAGLLRRAVDILDEYLPEVANMQVVLDTGAGKKNWNGAGTKNVAAERKNDALSMRGEVNSRRNTQGKGFDWVGFEKKGGVLQRWSRENLALGALIV